MNPFAKDSTNCCPTCGSRSTKVKRITLESLLTPAATGTMTEGQYRFCDSSDCTTVYFTENQETFSKDDLTVRVGVKEHTSPRCVCYCFDHTIEEIEAEVRTTGSSTVLDDIKARMKTGCWCETKSPQGSCCLGTVGKYVEQALTESGNDPDPVLTDQVEPDCCAVNAHAGSSSQGEAGVVNGCCSNTRPDEVAAGIHRRTGLLATGGSVLSALAASACCWIPLLLISLGVSAGGISAWFEQYRWLFLGITGLLLGAGFYSMYFRSTTCAPGTACLSQSLKVRRVNRLILWIATIFVLAAVTFPNYVGSLIGESPAARTADPAESLTTVSLAIEGMTCEGCAANLRKVLVKVPGVFDATVSYEDATVAISFDANSPPSDADLANAVDRAGFKTDTISLNR